MSDNKESAPDGWKLVPLKPTNAMLEEAYKAFQMAALSLIGFNAKERAYAALLNAAPAPDARAAEPSLTLSASDADFLAARLRRLFKHFDYSLPDSAANDASLIRVAGTCIGAVLTNIDARAAEVPTDIRAAGWAVAVHNDYRITGEQHTFWLFTKGVQAVKGEGRTDADALEEVRAKIGLASLLSAPKAAQDLREAASIAHAQAEHYLQTGEALAGFTPSAKPVRMTDERVTKLRTEHGWAKETIRAIESEVLGLAAPGADGGVE